MYNHKNVYKMKKTVYGIFAALTLVFAFAACDDSSDIDRGTHAQLPEQVIAGNYAGNYTIINASGDTTDTVAAAIALTAGENPYTVTFSSVCTTNTVLDGAEEGALNVAWANDDIKFWGPTTAGTNAGFFNSSALNGTYYPTDGTLTLKFSKTVREGRKTTTNFYVFDGTRQ